MLYKCLHGEQYTHRDPQHVDMSVPAATLKVRYEFVKFGGCASPFFGKQQLSAIEVSNYFWVVKICQSGDD